MNLAIRSWGTVKSDQRLISLFRQPYNLLACASSNPTDTGNNYISDSHPNQIQVQPLKSYAAIVETLCAVIGKNASLALSWSVGVLTKMQMGKVGPGCTMELFLVPTTSSRSYVLPRLLNRLGTVGRSLDLQ